MFRIHKFPAFLLVPALLLTFAFSGYSQSDISKKLYPKIAVPATGLVLADLQFDAIEGQIAATVLQGIVNRTAREKIYVFNTFCEDNRGNWNGSSLPNYPNQVQMGKVWLKEIFKGLPQQELKLPSNTKNPGFSALLAKYKSFVKGIIIYDPGLLQATIEAATTIAGQTDGVIVSPEMAEVLKPYGFKVIQDLRKQGFKSNVECLNWLLASYFEKASKQVAFTWSHMTTDAKSWGGANKDYVVANRLFTYYLDIKDKKESVHYIDVISKYPKGTPIVGWTDELFADNLFAEHGCFMVPFIAVENMTVMSSFPSVQGKQAPPKALPVASNAVYIAFHVPDGDNLLHTMLYEPFTILNSPAYGEIPLTWIINPSISAIAPPVYSWYLSKLGNQELGAMMGDGSPRSDRSEGFKLYCELAKHYMKQSGVYSMKQMAEGEAVAWNVKPYFLNSGYAGTDSRGIGPYEYHLDGETFHIGSLYQKEHDVKAIIKAAPQGKPLFLSIFAGTAAGDVCSDVKQFCEELKKQNDGKQYYFVRSMDLAATYRSYVKGLKP
ncbi:MAG: hypothetical protein V4594_08810 [Bacteroidota bacterium]